MYCLGRMFAVFTDCTGSRFDGIIASYSGSGCLANGCRVWIYKRLRTAPSWQCESFVGRKCCGRTRADIGKRHLVGFPRAGGHKHTTRRVRRVCCEPSLSAGAALATRSCWVTLSAWCSPVDEKTAGRWIVPQQQESMIWRLSAPSAVKGVSGELPTAHLPSAIRQLPVCATDPVRHWTIGLPDSGKRPPT